MEKEVLEAALAAKLTAGEWKVLAALSLGHEEIYDICRVTGLQKVRVQEVVQNARILRSSIITNITTTKVPVQNARTDIQPPPQAILLYLYTALNRPQNHRFRDLAVAKRMYIETRKGTQSLEEALWLIFDCIDCNIDQLQTATAPMLYLKALLTPYIKTLPRLPLELYEAQQADPNIRFRWNNRERIWERTNGNS